MDSECLWSMNYSYIPSTMECILTYCTNPTDAPNGVNGANYNFVWNQQRVRLGHSIEYPCDTNHAVENDTEWKSAADQGTMVKCGDDGEFIYPSPWPQCSTTVSCPDPGNSTEITRTLSYGTYLEYMSKLRYKCDDLRKWIRAKDTEVLADKIEVMCEWRQSYPIDGSNLECVIHHCRHPHDEPGNHTAPGAEYQIHLKEESDWTIQFDSTVRYECEAGTHIENTEIDPTETYIDVECITDVGEYNTPVRQGGSWPNCTETVICGLPPEPPVNGTRTWISPAVENQETYDTSIIYHCENGSQFDTDGDGQGDEVTVTIRCQWNKAWHPYLELPPCIVTHCVEPFRIPEETNLEEITSEWTPINTNKQYQCKNTYISNINTKVYTMFWESDRTRSTFELECKDDGYFTWEEWPICLTDITCSPDPPIIPTHSEYTLISDDGTVTVNSLIYPVYPSENRIVDQVLNSTENNTLIPKNYMTNLTYNCGSAREFFYEDGSQENTQSMSCQWDKTWTPTTELGECDWVACLKPPVPPVSTHLRITDWTGEPIPFGDMIRYVCDRGYQFEEDPSQIDVKYTCQDGTNPDHEDKRGFFDVPQTEEDWPRCLLGISISIKFMIFFSMNFSAPLCLKPPDAPEEGVQEYLPIPIPIEPEELCDLNDEDITLTCPTFLTIFINKVTYGRNPGKDLCDGDKPKDTFKPAGDVSCFDDSKSEIVANALKSECHGEYTCTYTVPTLQIGEACSGMRREVKVETLCGKHNTISSF